MYHTLCRDPIHVPNHLWNVDTSIIIVQDTFQIWAIQNTHPPLCSLPWQFQLWSPCLQAHTNLQGQRSVHTQWYEGYAQLLSCHPQRALVSYKTIFSNRYFNIWFLSTDFIVCQSTVSVSEQLLRGTKVFPLHSIVEHCIEILCTSCNLYRN